MTLADALHARLLLDASEVAHFGVQPWAPDWRLSVTAPDPADVALNVALLPESERDVARAHMLGVAQLRWCGTGIRVTVRGTTDEMLDEARIFVALMLRGMTDGFERPPTYAWMPVK